MTAYMKCTRHSNIALSLLSSYKHQLVRIVRRKQSLYVELYIQVEFINLEILFWSVPLETSCVLFPQIFREQNFFPIFVNLFEILNVKYRPQKSDSYWDWEIRPSTFQPNVQYALLQQSQAFSGLPILVDQNHGKPKLRLAKVIRGQKNMDVQLVECPIIPIVESTFSLYAIYKKFLETCQSFRYKLCVPILWQ